MSKTIKFRSKAEKICAEWLDKHGIKWEYEVEKLPFLSRVRSGECGTCHAKEVYQRRLYIPDFYIPSGKFFIEVKGRLTRRDRGKMKDIHTQHPNVDIRMLFSKNNKLERNINKRYVEWCEEIGYTHIAVGYVPPKEWFSELQPATPVS